MNNLIIKIKDQYYSLNKNDIYTAVNARQAKVWLKQYGFFANSVYLLIQRIKEQKGGYLYSISNTDTAPLTKIFTPYKCNKKFGLFIPQSKITIYERR